MSKAFQPGRTSSAAIRPPIWAALVPALFLAACGTTPEPEPAAEEPEEQVAETAQEEEIQEPREFEPAQRAPREYVVERGDTLWDISNMFLRDPWLWPEIWHINPQIHNPHLIYPGDVITLFYVDDRPHIEVRRDDEIYLTTLDIERLSPRIRYEDLPRAVPYVPADAIRPLLRRPQVLTDDMMDNAPYLLRSADGRLMTSAGDNIYVRNFNDSDATRYTILRPGQTYRDPDSGRALGQEAIFVGEAEFVRGGDPATLFVTRAVREALEGDRLFPIEDRVLHRDFYPRAPEAEIEGVIISGLEEGDMISQHDTVVLNRGTNHGLEPGHVLDVFQRGETVRDREQGLFGERVRLPDERIGLVMIYRVHDEVSYALVMQAQREISEGDRILNPRHRIRTRQMREPR
ncbi:LysM peptidoglycan-binding domain-containing protein [Gammaproteobacteria bacterium AB-CW1]|uniref:LysM peptidoglycan-binding domain-containing protein n=1 Tax=Natronospira elongata TaxID=3110268 RepID=A0AAP6JFS9_9GAMM|nr:LysM peptidoglycan-binding domain-containing protein [Gammaproteobacteria bacterium AB-CW1]